MYVCVRVCVSAKVSRLAYLSLLTVFAILLFCSHLSSVRRWFNFRLGGGRGKALNIHLKNAGQVGLACLLGAPRLQLRLCRRLGCSCACRCALAVVALGGALRL